jgi:hypothetical protein
MESIRMGECNLQHYVASGILACILTHYYDY